MGFRKRKSEESNAYATDSFEIYLQASKKADYKHERFGIGVQHLAFHAQSKEAVDGLFKDLQDIGAHISDPPADYPEYNPGYYAVFFQDPDGITLEYCYTPDFKF
jgi:catechol 2,3-dioxygenase-like lactoylglutathione lyase family enzyme